MTPKNKRLVLCFDGTWSALADPNALTNVVRLANLVTVNHEDVQQVTYYNSGVGTGGPVDQLLGGAFGLGLKSNVKRGLTFLALNYEEGDEIYLFGFSRGAYTARALAGVIGAAGIPLNIRHAEEYWNRYQQIAKLRPKPGTPRNSPKRKAAEEAIAKIREKLVEVSRNTKDGKWQRVPIKCVGVWDTVGSYGVPSGLGLGALPYVFTQWTRGFRDTHFGSTVEVGLHAIAIDERRRPFAPTFWTLQPPEFRDIAQKPGQAAPEEPPNVEQVWFAGVHANVGGGYTNSGLSDLALAWMLAQVQEKTDLRFNEDQAQADVWPCSACTLYTTTRWRWINPARSILPKEATGLAAFFRRLFTRGGHYRVRINEHVHWSVKERLGCDKALVDRGRPGRYAPANLKRDLKTYTVPLRLEQELLDPGREWADHCPRKPANLPCQCEKRDLQALMGGASASTRETPPQIAA